MLYTAKQGRPCVLDSASDTAECHEQAAWSAQGERNGGRISPTIKIWGFAVNVFQTGMTCTSRTPWCPGFSKPLWVLVIIDTDNWCQTAYINPCARCRRHVTSLVAFNIKNDVNLGTHVVAWLQLKMFLWLFQLSVWLIVCPVTTQINL